MTELYLLGAGVLVFLALAIGAERDYERQRTRYLARYFPPPPPKVGPDR